MICPCPCGFDLADGISLGIWTLAETAVEYRTCLHCKSTRAFMHMPEIEGQVVFLFHDPLSQEPMEPAKQWSNLLEALTEGPPADVAELRRGGKVLARAFCAIDGVLGWKVLTPYER